MKYYLAIDLGATSGRHVIGYLENDQIKLVELYRFKTEMDASPNGLVWDIDRIYQEIKNGIKKAFEKYPKIESLSIDTWGVDYVLMDNDKEIIPYYAYRNARCEESSAKLHKIIEFKDLYKRTGIQYAPFNTIYQLYDDLNKNRLDKATDYLMLPSYFSYKLTGIKTHEYTNESTTSLLNPKTTDYDYELIDKIGLPRKLFSEIKKPGEFIGKLKEEVQKEVNGNTKVILCASHDTASAFEAVDVKDNSVIISSGTWSLLGIKAKEAIITNDSFEANYTNEGGVGYIRFLKNIMGMYLANHLKEETNLSFDDINKLIVKSNYKETFDVNDKSLNAPISMRQALLELLKDNPPKDDIDLFASIYHSLALSYKKAIKELERITNIKFERIYIIGGGAKSTYLNNLVKEYTKIDVISLPIEATSLGNILVQMKGNNYEKRS